MKKRNGREVDEFDREIDPFDRNHRSAPEEPFEIAPEDFVTLKGIGVDLISRNEAITEVESDDHIDIYWCQTCGYRSSRNRERGNCWNMAFQQSFPNCPDCGKRNWKKVESI